MSGVETALLGAGAWLPVLEAGEIPSEVLLLFAAGAAIALLLSWPRAIEAVFEVLMVLCRVVIVPTCLMLGLASYAIQLAWELAGDVVRILSGNYFRIWEAIRRWVFLAQSWRRAWKAAGRRD